MFIIFHGNNQIALSHPVIKRKTHRQYDMNRASIVRGKNTHNGFSKIMASEIIWIPVALYHKLPHISWDIELLPQRHLFLMTYAGYTVLKIQSNLSGRKLAITGLKDIYSLVTKRFIHNNIPCQNRFPLFKYCQGWAIFAWSPGIVKFYIKIITSDLKI